MKLSVIIVSYNVEHYLKQCLNAVWRAIDGVESEVWVVDNASNDGSVAMIREQFPWVTLLANSKNMGFSHANNQALGKANGEYVLLLNPDTIIAEDTFANCIAFMDTHPDAASTGVKMLNRNGTFAMESRRGLLTLWVAFCKASRLCRLFPKSRLFGRYYMSYLDENSANRIDMVSGAFMFIRRSTLQQVGLLDESFFMYWEDTDLSYRLLKSGHANYYIPTPIFHYKGESSIKSTLRYRYYLYSSTLIFFKKHFPLNHALMYLPIRFAIWALRFRTHITNPLLYGKNWEKPEDESSDCYLMLGSKQAIDEVKRICEQNNIVAEHRFVEADEQSLPDGHVAVDAGSTVSYTHVLYDADSFSYRRILKLLQCTPGNTLKLATYSCVTHTLLTEKNIYILKP